MKQKQDMWPTWLPDDTVKPEKQTVQLLLIASISV